MSLFKSDTRASSTLFKVGATGDTAANLRDYQQNKLTRFNLSYAGLQYPTQDTDQKFVAQAGTASSLDNTTQVYLSSYACGFYSDSGTELIQEFRNAGMYLSYQIPKDGNDSSTDLIVRTEFAGGTENECFDVSALQDVFAYEMGLMMIFFKIIYIYNMFSTGIINIIKPPNKIYLNDPKYIIKQHDLHKEPSPIFESSRYTNTSNLSDRFVVVKKIH